MVSKEYAGISPVEVGNKVKGHEQGHKAQVILSKSLAVLLGRHALEARHSIVESCLLPLLQMSNFSIIERRRRGRGVPLVRHCADLCRLGKVQCKWRARSECYPSLGKTSCRVWGIRGY